MYDRWLVVAGGGKLVEELAKYSDDQMSFMEAAIDVQRLPFGMYSLRVLIISHLIIGDSLQILNGQKHYG